MISEVALKDGNKGLDALAGKATTGIPLGTWASFEKDYAPNPEWLEAGTDFDANAFPALAMYLGDNKVPERYDHSRLGEYENITLPTTSATALSMPYDGELIVRYLHWDNIMVYVNNEQMSGGRGYDGSSQGSSTIPFRKGDKIYVTYSRQYFNPKVAYYKHPMFIKATPTSSNSDYQGTLQAVMQYVRNMNSYSTEEKWTGGYWIDGKKIYRKCGNTEQSGVWPESGDYSLNLSWFKQSVIGNVTITKMEYHQNGKSGIDMRMATITANGVSFNYPYQSGLGYSTNDIIVFEYTKTTDV